MPFFILKIMHNKVYSVRSGDQTGTGQNQLVTHAANYYDNYYVVF